MAKHNFPFEGWGLTHGPDHQSFLATNSSEFVLAINGKSFELESATPATCLGQTVSGLNELEMVDDFLGNGPALMGNVIDTRVVLVLDPVSANCLGAFHLEDLEVETAEEARGRHVANGIAFDKQSGNFWVTGKNWDQMFEITVGEIDNEDKAMSLLAKHLDSF
mmetsp:Transcript_950/g.2114  ORF Transcript_950/g.2114 Transcript_950/m.2114 type:complete len:164 (+) Transcript_950:598-1089(+)